MTALFIASKLSDCGRLRLPIILNTITSGKYASAQIKTMEIHILRAINFNPDLPNVYEIIEQLFAGFLCGHRELEGKEVLRVFNKLKYLCIYFAIMCSYDYDVYSAE